MNKIIYAFVFLTIIFLPLQDAKAQSRFTKQIRGGIIVNGLFDSDPSITSSYTTHNYVIPGLSFELGGNYGYYLTKKRNLKLSISTMLEFRSFTWFSASNFENRNISKQKKKMRSTYFTLPLELEFKVEKWSITGGFIGTLNLWTKYKRIRCSAPPEEDCDYRELYSITSFIDNAYHADVNMVIDVNRTKWLDFQYSLGVRYQLNSKIAIGIEFRDFIFDNFIEYTYFDYDVIGNDELLYQTKGMYLSAFYSME